LIEIKMLSVVLTEVHSLWFSQNILISSNLLHTHSELKNCRNSFNRLLMN